MKQTLNPIEEAIRLLNFTPSDDKLDSLIYEVMSTEYESAFPLVKEQEMLQQLNVVAHQTLGAVLQSALIKEQISVLQLANEIALPERVFNELLADSIAITNIPIMLFKKLTLRLEVSFNEVKEAVRHTTRNLQFRLSSVDSLSSVAFNRKPVITPFGFQAETQSGHGLFESDEAIELYLKRLEELLND